MKQLLSTGLFLVLISCNAFSSEDTIVSKFSSEGMELQAEVIATGLGTPWAFDFISEKELLVTDRGGQLFRLNLDSMSRNSISGLPEVRVSGQGGLLDLRLHPNFKENAWVYFTYSRPIQGQSTTALARAKLKKNKLENFELLFSAEPAFSTAHHYGSRIAFDRKGYVFLSVGDRGRRKLAQSLETHNGKIIRLKENGETPKDNPFVGQDSAKPEIWSYGHRNPQGLIYIDNKQELWAHEHGPKGGDEINKIEKGNNYGWPVITYGREYSGGEIGDGIQEKAGMEQPKKYYAPSIAPSGFCFYTGSKLPAWKNSFFIGALVLTHLNRVRLPDFKEERLLSDLGERIRDVRQSPEGYLYISTDSGKLIRLKAR